MKNLMKKIGILLLVLLGIIILCSIEGYILQVIFGNSFNTFGYPLYIFICFVQGWFIGDELFGSDE